MLLMQKTAKNAKPASIKINSMFWTTVLFVCHVLTNTVRVIEQGFRLRLEAGGRTFRPVFSHSKSGTLMPIFEGFLIFLLL